jgi:hypothetical protein
VLVDRELLDLAAQKVGLRGSLPEARRGTERHRSYTGNEKGDPEQGSPQKCQH